LIAAKPDSVIRPARIRRSTWATMSRLQMLRNFQRLVERLGVGHSACGGLRLEAADP
jgi:hypothetical protein